MKCLADTTGDRSAVALRRIRRLSFAWCTNRLAGLHRASTFSCPPVRYQRKQSTLPPASPYQSRYRAIIEGAQNWLHMFSYDKAHAVPDAPSRSQISARIRGGWMSPPMGEKTREESACANNRLAMATVVGPTPVNVTARPIRTYTTGEANTSSRSVSPPLIHASTANRDRYARNAGCSTRKLNVRRQKYAGTARSGPKTRNQATPYCSSDFSRSHRRTSAEAE